MKRSLLEICRHAAEQLERTDLTQEEWEDLAGCFRRLANRVEAHVAYMRQRKISGQIEKVLDADTTQSKRSNTKDRK